MKNVKILLLGLILGVTILFAVLYWHAKTLKTVTLAPTTNQSFNKSVQSNTDPTSTWVVVNKKRPIPNGYQPSDLVKPTIAVNTQKSDEENTISVKVAPSLKQLVTDAKSAGYDLFMGSGYRSVAQQTIYFNNYVARDGLEAANKYSAVPGQSEHQTGYALDIARADRYCYIELCFADTPEGKWIANNAYKYGFIIRYPKNKTDSTGYQYEPWHLRYVGVELAAELKRTGQTLEEYFGLN